MATPSATALVQTSGMALGMKRTPIGPKGWMRILLKGVELISGKPVRILGSWVAK